MQSVGVVTQSRDSLQTLWTVARQAPLSLGFSRQECWSGQPFFSRGSSQPRDGTQLSHVPTEPPGKAFWSLPSPSRSDGKASAYNAGDPGSIPGWGRSLEKEMATHSSILAWRTPWTEEPGRLQSVGSKGVGHDRVTDRLPLLGRCPKHLPGCDKPKWVQILLFVPYGSKPLPG